MLHNVQVSISSGTSMYGFIPYFGHLAFGLVLKTVNSLAHLIEHQIVLRNNGLVVVSLKANVSWTNIVF